MHRQHFWRPLLIQTLIWLPLIAMAGAGCALMGGGNAPPPKSKHYRVSAPEGWKEDDRADSDRAYRLASGSLVTLNSSCTRNSDAPLEVLTKHLLFGARNVQVDKRETMTVAGEQGLYSQVRATVDKVPFYLHLFVLPKSGCVFDFSLMNPKGISEKDGEEFLAFVKSFKHGSH